MFAVPGWSVSADKLKVEQVQKKNNAGPAPGKSNKRKRPDAGDESVTAANVADLWDSVVEGKTDAGGQKSQQQQQKKKKNKKQKKEQQPSEGETQPADEQADEPSAELSTKKEKKKKSKKEKRQEKDAAPTDVQEEGTGDEAVTKATAKTKTSTPAPPKLTPLQASMREKLISARFRHLNETLYTKPSEEAYELFQESPEMFDEYHEGFRRQVKVWPENPVDSFLEDIRARGKVRTPGRGQPNPSGRLAEAPLPRTGDTCTIADLGCGDARLAESLQKDQKKLRVEMRSFDLQSPSALVTKADIANLPLEDGSVNVAIFCLALMGTNWLDFVEEAFRILHWKGELWIAEIKSRFGPVRSKNAPVTHSVGNRKKTGRAGVRGAAARDAEGGAAHEQDLAVEVDGMDDRRRETDVSAFVEALRKRGFVLNGDRSTAVDLSNKMFVKMHFIKGATPTKGKGAVAREAASRGKKAFGRKFEDVMDVQEDEPNENSILKPCVYKIR
ncbi:methyltransferase-domain-containing protein [Stachybotrys elegans]|uniref:Ribosomal RNA-processing protein 8 n=1 Tax=Stachybotrys elegans TaxID=80388 RepID=A0A8K0T6U2_9HYPO|nr:methyltransferase-domain-containing protein [Stachybotrys elegans]